MPRVLRIINRFNLGGPTFNAAFLTKYLEPEFETLLIGGEKEDSEDSSTFILEDLNIQPTLIPEMKRAIHPYHDWKALKKIKAIIRNFKPDIIHTHASKAGTLGRIAGIQMNVPIMVHTFHGHVFHSYFGNLKTNLYKNIERYLASKSSKIIAISEIQKQELVEQHQICSDNKITVIPLGFDLTRFITDQSEKRNIFREKYDMADDEIAIGIVGRLVPIKNHPLFIKGIETIAQKTTKKIRAFIIGDGEIKNELIQCANKCSFSVATPEQPNKSATLTFTSWIRNIDLAYAGLDIVALTSLNEGTPVSIIEAQAAGKPVVATNVGGIENIVKPNESALLSPSNDLTAFTTNLLNLVENTDMLLSMGNTSQEFVLDNFHYNRLTTNMLELYTRLLKTRN